jgi:hypothetical protein
MNRASCPKCKFIIPWNSKFWGGKIQSCPRCGTPLQASLTPPGILLFCFPIVWLFIIALFGFNLVIQIFIILMIYPAFFLLIQFLHTVKEIPPGESRREFWYPKNFKKYFLNRRFLIIVGLYLTLWVLTFTVGRNSVHNQIEGRWKKEISTAFPINEFKYLELKEMLQSSPANADSPYYYISGGFSPCPFVIVIDSGFMAGFLFGRGYRSFYLWLPGKPILIKELPLWIS